MAKAMSSDDYPDNLNGRFLVESWSEDAPAPGVGIRPEPRRPDDQGLLKFASGDSILHIHRTLKSKDDKSAMRHELLLEEGNLLPFHFLRVGDRIGRAVVKIQREDGATGTGFLVASDILLTNHHVLPDLDTAAGSVALANYEVNPPEDSAGRTTVAPLDPQTLFVTNADLDFTFCGVRGLDYLGSVPLDRGQMLVNTAETVNIIQHPRGRPKEVVLRDNWVVRADSVVLHYSCDTEPGSSGSPVFNNEWRPVALHHASVLTDSPEGRAVSGGDSGRYINEGIRLSAIALWLETAEASSHGRRGQVARLRALFGGLNAKVGFFGALGRRSHGRSAHELVAESYLRAVGTLDVGFWNTEPMGGVRREHVGEIAQVMADMSLDLWCVTHADPYAVDMLCRLLHAGHRLDYEPVHAGADDQASPVFLYRKLSGLQVERRPSEIAPASGEPTPLHEPAAIKIRTGRGRDEVMELGIVAITRDSDLDRIRERSRSGDWLFLADHAPSNGPGPIGRTSGTTIVARGDQGEGEVIWVSDEDSHVEQIFATPNLRVVAGPTARFAAAADRSLPASLERLGGSRPVAVRLALRDESAVARPPADVGRDADRLFEDLERRLRASFEPILASLLSELKDG